MLVNHKRIAGLIIKQRFEVASAEECWELELWACQSPSYRAFIQERLSEDVSNWRMDLKELQGAVSWFRVLYWTLSVISLIGAVWFGVARSRAYTGYAKTSEIPVRDRVGSMEVRSPLLVTKVSALAPAVPNGQLLLANNSKKDLSDFSAGSMVTRQGDAIVSLLEKGHVQYASDSNSSGAGLFYNQLSTPRGGYYRITLQDGTEVYLNAGSTLRYPARFADGVRDVDLEGEAYFKVKPVVNGAGAKIPFIVHVNSSHGKTEFMVWGTELNISSYPDDAGCRASLLDGTINVKEERVDRPGEWGDSRIMLPGEEYTRAHNSAAGVIGKGDMDIAFAWKQGFFLFKNTPLPDIMRQVARWYNAELVYEGNIQENVTLSYPRTQSVGGLLDRLSRLTRVRFRVIGNTIYCAGTP